MGGQVPGRSLQCGMSFNGRPVFLNIPLGPRFYPGPGATGPVLLRGRQGVGHWLFCSFPCFHGTVRPAWPSWFLKSRLPASVYLYLYPLPVVV